MAWTPAVDEVAVWWVETAQAAAWLDALAAVLAPEERARADRFHFERDRRQYVVARGLLRYLLGAATGRAPGALRFVYGEHGKPGLDSAEIAFNVSHSAECIVYACTTLGPVGVDVEHIRTLTDREAVARRVFSPREWAAYDTTPPDQRDRQFFHGWTRKEAFIKAVGDGLAYPLHDFDVALAPGAPARLLAVRGSADAAARWTLRDIPVADGYLAALAVPHTPVTVTVRPVRALPAA